MNIYCEYIILGLIQGLTEFLPVSSSGHLILAEKLGLGEPSLAVNLALHIATLAVVLVVFRKSIVHICKHPTCRESIFVLTASVPTAAMAGAIRYFLSDSYAMLPFCFVVTAVLLVLPNFLKKNSWTLADKHFWRNALLVGISQGFACFNGISRSGSTTSIMRCMGLSGKESADISFLLSIPIILGSSVVELMSSGLPRNVPVFPLICGMAVAFFVGMIAVKSFIKIIVNEKLWIFSIYVFFVGIASFFIL